MKEKNKKIKNILKMIIFFLVILIIIFFSLAYKKNIKFRFFLDKYVFMKEINIEQVEKILLDSSINNNIFSYDKYIMNLSKNKLRAYRNNNKIEFELDINISNPIFKAKDSFLLLAENKGNACYLISDKNIVWQKDIDGEIQKVYVNKNGYSAIITNIIPYKSVIIIYNGEGKELFRTYLSTNYATDLAISNNNKILAISELNSSGVKARNNIKLIEIDKAKNKPETSMKYLYENNIEEIMINMDYKNKNKLICMYSNDIREINEEEIITLYKNNDNTIFYDINLEEHIVVVEKDSQLLKTYYNIIIKNIDNKREKIYNIEYLPKSIYCYKDMIAINLGMEIHFVNTNGWLVKKYLLNEDIKDVILLEDMVGLVLKERIELIKLK